MRKKELDIAKGIGILLMVLLHMHFNETVVNYFLHGFLMRMFFIVSGILYKRRALGGTVKARARTLLVPYCFFGVLYTGITVVQALVSHDSGDTISSAVKKLFLFPTDNFQIESALWFLPVMFISSVLYCLLDSFFKDRRLLTVASAVIGTAGYVLPKLIGVRLIWGLEPAFVGVLCIRIGALIKEYDVIEKLYAFKTSRKLWFYAGLTVVTAGTAALIFVNDHNNMRLAKWGIFPLSFFNSTVFGIIIIILSKIAAGIKSADRNIIIRWLCRISVTSIVYVCINHPCIKVSKYVLGRAFGLAGVSSKYIIYPVAFVFTLGMLFVISEIVYRTGLKKIFGR